MISSLFSRRTQVQSAPAMKLVVSQPEVETKEEPIALAPVHKSTKGMTFEDAMYCLRRGIKIRRASWRVGGALVMYEYNIHVEGGITFGYTDIPATDWEIIKPSPTFDIREAITYLKAGFSVRKLGRGHYLLFNGSKIMAHSMGNVAEWEPCQSDILEATWEIAE